MLNFNLDRNLCFQGGDLHLNTSHVKLQPGCSMCGFGIHLFKYISC